MNSENLLKTSSFVLVVLVLTGLTAFALPTLQNGDFSVELDPVLNWSVESGLVERFEDEGSGGYFALFTEVLDGQVPDGIIIESALGQEFKFPTGAQTLSFNVVISSQVHESDSFTASLYDNRTDHIPLAPGYDEFFYIDTGYLMEPPAPGSWHTLGTFDSNTVTLDVSAFQGQDAYLLFTLNPEIDDFQTFVELRNVEISVVPVPVPGAVVLGGLGFGCVAWLRRRRIL